MRYEHESTNRRFTESVHLVVGGKAYITDRTVYEHLGRGQWLVILFNSNPMTDKHEEVGRLLYSYDGDGNLTEARDAEGDAASSEAWLSTYLRDERGNWIERRERSIDAAGKHVPALDRVTRAVS